MTGRPAVFLDRDGTVIEDTGFVAAPGTVRLIPGSAEAIARLGRAGWAVIVVTNQSGIARGILSQADYEAVHLRMLQLLEAAGARPDATYMCPHHPELTGPCDCRKPAMGNYQRAAAAFGLDLARSVWIGDRMTDLEPALAAGGQAILVRTGQGRQSEADAAAAGFRVADDLAAAVAGLLEPGSSA